MEARGWNDERKEPGAKERRWPLEAKKGKGMNTPHRGLQKESALPRPSEWQDNKLALF